MLCRIEDLPVLLRPKMTVSGASGMSPLSAKHLKSFNRILSMGMFVRLLFWHYPRNFTLRSVHRQSRHDSLVLAPRSVFQLEQLGPARPAACAEESVQPDYSPSTARYIHPLRISHIFTPCVSTT